MLTFLITICLSFKQLIELSLTAMPLAGAGGGPIDIPVTR
jgi:hypothetical protein